MSDPIAHLWRAHAQKSVARATDASGTPQAANPLYFATQAAFPPNKKRKRTSDHATKAASQTGPAKSLKAHAKEFKAGETDLGSGSVLIVEPRAFKQTESQQLYKALKEQVPWLHKEITMYGKQVMQPRQVAYMAENPSLSYTYSHTKMHPEPWHPSVAQVKAKLEAVAGVTFNSCLLNLYRSGADHMGWHSDNEKLYGDDPVIGSVSFGATRRFLLRRNGDHNDKWSYELASGDILIMKGTTQRHWMHSIPKMLRIDEPRINLTFRQITHPEN